MLQDNFVAELSAHYQNYILPTGTGRAGQVSERQEGAGRRPLWYGGPWGPHPSAETVLTRAPPWPQRLCGQHCGSQGEPSPHVSNRGDSSPGALVSVAAVGLSQHHADVSSCSIHADTVTRAAPGRALTQRDPLSPLRGASTVNSGSADGVRQGARPSRALSLGSLASLQLMREF